MSLMDGAVRMVLLQFSFSNLKLIPPEIRRDDKVETAKEFVARKSQLKGQQILEPVEAVGCLGFLQDLESAGYVLVDAFAKVREQNGRKYGTVRFIFVQEEHDESSQEFKDELREPALTALRRLLSEAAWRTRAFLNYFFKEGRVVDEVFSISVNLEARSPLVNGDGKPILERKSDGTLVPMRAKKVLKIQDGQLCVENA